MKTETFVRGTLAALAALSLFPVAARAALTQTVAAGGDTFVRSTPEKRSFGFESQIELRMNAAAGASEGYVQFPLPQHAPFAEKIVLRLYGQMAEPGALKVLVRSVAPGAWDEFALNWRTRPEHRETIGTLNVVGLSGAWYEADVTAHARAEARAGRTNVTFALMSGEESKNRATICSRENALKKPELVFTRPLISARISFIPTNSFPPEGHLADQGEVFGPRTNGFTYGWNVDNRDFMRDRNDARLKRDKNAPLKSADRRHDFLAYMDHERMKAPVTWEMALPNGNYKVRLVAGDAQKYDSIYGLTAEGTTVIDGVPDTKQRWLEGTATVSVKDGRLSIGHAPGSTNNKLCWIEVTEVETLLTQTK